MRVHPDFIIIGAPRSGTSFLYGLLAQHPDVYLRRSKRPEPHFFMLSSRYEKGIDYYYEQVFGEFKGQKLSGEASTTMLYGLGSPKLVFDHNPKTKIICFLRPPVERMVSEYSKSVETNWEDLSFEEALSAEDRRVQESKDEYARTFEPGSYKKRGLYMKFLNNWIEEFGSENVYVGLFEDLVNNPQDEFAEVLKFLNLDECELILEDSDRNESTYESVDIESAIINELKEYYRPSLKDLEEFMNKDLSRWYQ